MADELTNEDVARALGWEYNPDGWPVQGRTDGLLRWRSPDGKRYYGPNPPDFLHDMNAAVQHVWPALRRPSYWALGPLADGERWLFNIPQTLHGVARIAGYDVHQHWLEPVPATAICKQLMAEREAGDATT